MSAIRLVCTWMIVALHISQQMESRISNLRILTDWLNLGLVMFFSISAFLYSRRQIENVVRWYLHRYLEIVISAVLIGGGTLLVFALTKGVTESQVTGTILSCTGLHLFAPDCWMFEQLWFLTYILFFYLTVPLIQKIPFEKGSALKFWGVLGAAVAVLQVGTALLGRVTSLPIMSIGVLLRAYLPYCVYKRYDIHGEEIKPVVYTGTALSVAAVGITCYLRYYRMGLLSAELVELMFIYTQTLTGSVLFYWLYRGLQSIRTYSVLLRLSDRYSYEIYLTHCLFIGYSTSVLKAVSNPVLGIGAALGLTILTSVLIRELAGLVKKPFNTIINNTGRK